MCCGLVAVFVGRAADCRSPGPVAACIVVAAVAASRWRKYAWNDHSVSTDCRSNIHCMTYTLTESWPTLHIFSKGFLLYILLSDLPRNQWVRVNRLRCGTATPVTVGAACDRRLWYTRPHCLAPPPGCSTLDLVERTKH